MNPNLQARTNAIHQEIWSLSPLYQNRQAYVKLTQLTQELIQTFEKEGRLVEDPFTPTTKRKLQLDEDKIGQLLKHKICLVTGGLGCVGSALVNKLLSFEVEKIIIIDKQMPAPGQAQHNDRIYFFQTDITNSQSLNNIFEIFEPHFVFHTAAERNPGYAESHVVETVRNNVIGTFNVVNACERVRSVQQCIFSSTGKSSRYYTTEVYAATKKICEYLLDSAAKKNTNVKYAMVRFTHMLENSLMKMELQQVDQADSLAIHSPGKYVTAQNVAEATSLLLNALLHSVSGQANFLIVRNLEWPVESLEVALYYIKKSGKSIPILYKGNPKGYTEKFFRGQMDWSAPTDLNLLINVYESKKRAINKAGDIIISSLVPTDEQVLTEAIRQLKQVDREETARKTLIDELKKIVEASLVHVNKAHTVDILKWGLQPQYLKSEGTNITDYQPMVSLLIDSLQQKPPSMLTPLYNNQYFSKIRQIWSKIAL